MMTLARTSEGAPVLNREGQLAARGWPSLADQLTWTAIKRSGRPAL
ncbi:hypothetical protein AGR13a_Lc30056 [Agrobacterium genomosp. 13 str. CFBP 6927]|uniref:Uncharacterized protein n=1 Tax=Agrobacterium genomosp. 13 str. CFBP 6927 TaxID=1183428 RepID=A0ABP2BQQ2_9HYPH|nr:hypothetical protein AGR13a_Lc30056 [Agrobacterium genomosp. 13 str. CFBP 6927]